MGAGRSILVDKNGYIIAGNKTAAAALDAGIEDVVIVETTGDRVVVVQRTDLDLSTDPKAKKLAVTDNRASELGLNWDIDALKVVADEIDISWLFTDEEIEGLDGWDMEGDIDDDGDEEVYTRKIEAPIYTPTGENPDISDLYDPHKTKEMIKRISDADIDDPHVVEFLKMAAYRHTVFNFGKIAEYYAGASPEIQRLMEDSALVIIDFDQAIEKNYVMLCESIRSQYSKDYGDD
jgi:hypothetical protein